MSDNDKRDNELIRAGGLYRNISKDGKPYLTGYLSLRLVAFENSYKRGDNDPDYILYVEQRRVKLDDTPAGDDDDNSIPF